MTTGPNRRVWPASVYKRAQHQRSYGYLDENGDFIACEPMKVKASTEDNTKPVDEAPAEKRRSRSYWPSPEATLKRKPLVCIDSDGKIVLAPEESLTCDEEPSIQQPTVEQIVEYYENARREDLETFKRACAAIFWEEKRHNLRSFFPDSPPRETSASLPNDGSDRTELYRQILEWHRSMAPQK